MDLNIQSKAIDGILPFDEFDITEAKILIVDQTEQADVLNDYLKKNGFKNVYVINQIQRMIDIWKIFKPDLIMVDLKIQGGNVFELIEQLKSSEGENVSGCFLLMAEKITKKEKEIALKLGVYDFLKKPFDFNEIALRVGNVLLFGHGYRLFKGQLDNMVEKRTRILKEEKQELHNSNMQSESINKLKTAFLRNFSHELRTPIYGIVGVAELLMYERIDDKEKDTFMNLLEDSVNRLLKTMDNYIDISQIISNSMFVNLQRIKPYALITKEVDQYKETCKNKQINLKLNIPENLEKYKMITEPMFLKKIVNHLMSNACKFTEQGEIIVGLKMMDKGLEFFVEDTGIGIEKQKQHEIFDYCQQIQNGTTRQYEGTGLGLSVVKGLLKLLNGDIKVDSVQGKGTCFKVYIPAASEINF